MHKEIWNAELDKELTYEREVLHVHEKACLSKFSPSKSAFPIFSTVTSVIHQDPGPQYFTVFSLAVCCISLVHCCIDALIYGR